MEYQKPALGITQTFDYGKSSAYRIDCTCGDTTHDISMFVEHDHDHGGIVVETFVTVTTDYWTELLKWQTHNIDNPLLYSIVYNVKQFVNGLYTRLRLTYHIWTEGYMKFEGSTIMKDQQAYNYGMTLVKLAEKGNLDE